MKLPLTFIPGRYERGLLLKTPQVLDAAGDRVVSITLTPALMSSIGDLNAVAAGFAAYPDLLDALEWLVDCADPDSDGDLDRTKDITHALGRARVAIAKARVVPV